MSFTVLVRCPFNGWVEFSTVDTEDMAVFVIDQAVRQYNIKRSDVIVKTKEGRIYEVSEICK